jgi:site-specific recombinase XerD
MNIKQLHEKFCQEALLIRNNSPATIKWYQVSLNGFLKYWKGKVVSLEQITTERLREYLYSKRVNGNWTAVSFLNQYKGIKLFLKWCVNREYIHKNPIVTIERPKLHKKLPRRVTKQEALRILEYSFNMKTTYRFERYRNAALFAIIIFAGLRANEVLSLKITDVDMVNKVIHINEGKGGKDRVIPMATSLYNYLQQYIDDRNRLEKTSNAFFASLRGDKAFTYNGLKKVVDRIRKGTLIDFSAHKLRHTFATLMLEGGCDLFSLQKMMGHSDIKTTTIYLSASVNHLNEQILKHPLG